MNLVHRFETCVFLDHTEKISQGPNQAMTTESTAIDVLDHAEFLNQSQVLPKRAKGSPFMSRQ
jgi:hypothetical protein